MLGATVVDEGEIGRGGCLTLQRCCLCRFAATKMFVSNLNARLAQRFLALVLLPRVRRDIAEHKRLHFALFQSLKKATYKPGAFYKVRHQYTPHHTHFQKQGSKDAVVCISWRKARVQTCVQ